ncbi:MAG: sulfotransferase family protein [Salinivenus sp.]
MLPTFLGIGVNKAGTTWLHDLLASHPHIWMPRRRKEVNFFTKHYDEGLDWYERFFPEAYEAQQYRAIGEYSPAYFYDDRCPARIAAIPSVQRLILSLRNPVDRVYSAYGHSVRNYNYRASFETYLEDHPHQIERGMYASHLKAYLQEFDREQFLILRFETMFSESDATQNALADALGVDRTLFPDDFGKQQRNATFVPRFQRAFAIAQSVIRTMKKWEMGRVLDLMQRTGVGPFLKRLFGRQEKEDALPDMQPETRARLAQHYAPEIEELEALTGMDFSIWKRDLPL